VKSGKLLYTLVYLGWFTQISWSVYLSKMSKLLTGFKSYTNFLRVMFSLLVDFCSTLESYYNVKSVVSNYHLNWNTRTELRTYATLYRSRHNKIIQLCSVLEFSKGQTTLSSADSVTTSYKLLHRCSDTYKHRKIVKAEEALQRQIHIEASHGIVNLTDYQQVFVIIINNYIYIYIYYIIMLLYIIINVFQSRVLITETFKESKVTLRSTSLWLQYMSRTQPKTQHKYNNK